MQQFPKSSSAMSAMHRTPCTRLTHRAASHVRSAAACVAFCTFALQACWLLNQETLSLPPARFSSTLVQPHHLSTKWLSSFFLPPVCLCNCPPDLTRHSAGQCGIASSCSCLSVSVHVLYVIIIKAGATAIGLFKFISPLFYCLILMDLNKGMLLASQNCVW